MAADGEQALRHGKVAIAQRTLGDRLGGEQRLQLAPQCDALEQRAGLVEARQAERQRRIHVEVNVDERRRNQTALRVDSAGSLSRDVALDGGDLAVANTDIEAGAAVGQGGVANDQVEHRFLKAPGLRWAPIYYRSQRSSPQFRTLWRAGRPTMLRPACRPRRSRRGPSRRHDPRNATPASGHA